MIELIIAILVLLNIADLILTKNLLDKDMKEGNPVMRFLIKKGLLIPAKIVLTIICCIAIWLGELQVIGVVLIGFYTFIVAHNVMVWKKVKK